MEELAEDDQAVEASVVQGVEDAADHPERRTHTHRRKYPTRRLPPRPDDEAA
jgi:hypothetical protein